MVKNMHIPKRYGESKIDSCPFCGKRAVTKNSQGVPTCIEHKPNELLDLKCVCGDWLDILSGKFGPYFRCLRCGNISWRKGLEVNEDKIKQKINEMKNETKSIQKNSMPAKETTAKPKTAFTPFSKNKKDITITSDECDAYFS